MTKSNKKGVKISAVKNEIKKIIPEKPVLSAIHEPLRLSYLWKKGEEVPSFLDKKRVCIFSAICDGSYFRHTIEGLGAFVESEFIFPDHYNYKKRDLEKIINECRHKNIELFVTTEKDAVKLKNLSQKEAGFKALVLEIRLRITEGDETLDDALRRLHMRDSRKND